jgi:MFS family permease
MLSSRVVIASPSVQIGSSLAPQYQRDLWTAALKTGLAWLAASVTALALAGPAQMLVTRVSAKLVMAVGMTLVGAGILWATQVPAHGHYWADLAGPFFVIGAGAAFTFIPVSIGALAGVGERDAGIASGLLNTSQQIGGAIGVAVASTVAATHSRLLLSQGHTTAAALTGGFQWAFWVTGLTGLAAVPVTFLLIRRTELARAVAASLQREPWVAAAD